MGYQTSWLTHGHDIALLKSPQRLLCLPVTAVWVGVSKRSPQKVGRKPELDAGSPFPKRERLLGSLKKLRIYNPLIL